MRLNKKCLITAAWIILIFILKINNLITFDLEVIRKFLKFNAEYAMVIFIALWIVRIISFIPGVSLMVLGGICFGTTEGFMLSMIGMIVSESLIYLISKTITNTRLKNAISKKYPDITLLIERYKYRFLALGIICPIAPTDAICFLSASTGIKYVKYILTVIIANIPVIMLYSYLGIGYKGSLYIVALLVLTISITTLFSIKTWYSLKNSANIKKVAENYV